MDERTQALAEIADLARRHGLTAADIVAALGGEPPPAVDQESRRRAVLVSVLGFLGGTFVFAGIGVFIALQWNAMNSAARVIVTLGSGLAALALALISIRDPRFTRATTPLLLVAAALEPTGFLVAFNEFGSGGDWRWAGLVTAGVMALQFAGVFASLRRSTPLFFTIFFATLFWWTALDLVGMDDEFGAMILGTSLLLTAVGVDRSGHADISPAIYLVGAIGALYGFFEIVENTPFEILFIAAAAGMVYLSVVVHSRMLLFVSTLAILAYTGYFTGEHFADSVGWPIALIVFGLVMIGLSALAVRIDRDYVRTRG
jgi:MFS family permease